VKDEVTGFSVRPAWERRRTLALTFESVTYFAAGLCP
jgi:hypothetical protein